MDCVEVHYRQEQHRQDASSAQQGLQRGRRGPSTERVIASPGLISQEVRQWIGSAPLAAP